MELAVAFVSSAVMRVDEPARVGQLTSAQCFAGRARARPRKRVRTLWRPRAASRGFLRLAAGA